MSCRIEHRPAIGRVVVVATLLVLLTALSNGCNERSRPVRNAFYFWRSTFTLSADDVQYLATADIGRLYIKFFDVDWDRSAGEALPVARIRFASPVPHGVEVVPTVFITNEVMRNTMGDDVDSLAGRIAGKIAMMAAQLAGVSITEVQFDCDWTSLTRTSYFRLLESLRRHYHSQKRPVTVSATIRLHQIKFFERTGVPPIDRGMLMAYNVGTVTSLQEQNSIFTAGEVEKYLERLGDYPLPLDAALPIFSWGVVFHNDHFAFVIGDLRREDLLTSNDFRPLDDRRFVVERELYRWGRNLSRGDIIRVEEVEMEDCRKVARTIASSAGRDSMSIALFHYDPELIDTHERKDIEAVYSSFH